MTKRYFEFDGWPEHYTAKDLLNFMTSARFGISSSPGAIREIPMPADGKCGDDPESSYFIGVETGMDVQENMDRDARDQARRSAYEHMRTVIEGILNPDDSDDYVSPPAKIDHYLIRKPEWRPIEELRDWPEGDGWIILTTDINWNVPNMCHYFRGLATDAEMTIDMLRKATTHYAVLPMPEMPEVEATVDYVRRVIANGIASKYDDDDVKEFKQKYRCPTESAREEDEWYIRAARQLMEKDRARSDKPFAKETLDPKREEFEKRMRQRELDKPFIQEAT
jgi:hypothetical protein